MDNYWRLGRTKPSKNTFYKFFAAANIRYKELFKRIFARKRTYSVWRILPPPKMRQTRRSRIEQPLHNHEASDLASAKRSPRPQAGQAVDTPQTKPAQAGGALDH